MTVFETPFAERSLSMRADVNEIEYCVRLIEELREENARLRFSAASFGALAERLNAALRRERGTTAPDDDAAHDSSR
jgi:hypothetical protein